MLRVLTLSTLFPDASRPNFGVFVERQTLALAVRDGVEVRVVAPRGLPPWPLSRAPHYRALAALSAVETWRGLTVHRPAFPVLPGTGGRLSARALAGTLVPLLRRLRHDFAFDVIDASFFYPDGPAAVALGRRFHVPVSIKARGADIHHWGRAPGTRRQVLAAGLAADGLLAVSGAMREDMAALGMPADRIRVHYTGVDLDRFVLTDQAAAKAVLGISGPLIVSLGALIPRKGHEVVIGALARLPGATLLIAGEGPERARLIVAAQEHGVADRVRLLGSVPHADLPALLAAADVMALASASEGLANAWVEALACGTPVVITEAGGARELLTDPAYGRIAARDAAAFAAAIGKLLTDPPARQAVRTGAERFTWEANAAALEQHLRALVERARYPSSNPPPARSTGSVMPPG